MIQVKPIEGKGRGVVATDAIARGEVISVCPTIKMPAGAMDRTPLENHVCTDGDATFLALGPQTLVNHDDNPNCISFLHNGEDFLVAIREIREGEELLLHYGDFCSDWDGIP